MNALRRLLVLLALVGLACNAPSLADTPIASPEPPTPTQEAPGPAGRCGDGVCEGPENADTCPADCAAQSVTSVPSADESAAAYITFVINVHDIVHPGDSADILLRLTDLFESYGVRGDFYLTGPITHLYAEQRPDVIERLRDSEMTISYHMRPPHPVYSGFDQRLQGLDDESLVATLRDYETYRLDLTTGNLLYDQPGGYTYVAETIGRPPVVSSAPNERWRAAALPLFAELGAQATVIYHESGTDLEQPFEWWSGLLARPSDFSITRWPNPNQPDKNPFWWNMLDSPVADQYNPTARLQAGLAAWEERRPPFITVLIHENNFYRRGGTPFTFIYWADKDKTQPLSPPFDLDAPDASQPRSPENMDAIWVAYEELVAYAAANLEVVTSEDIVALAGESISMQSKETGS